MRTIEVFDESSTKIGIITDATVQVSIDRHATSGGYVGGFYQEAVPISKGHFRPLLLKDQDRTYLQCWLHAKTVLAGKLHAVFSFTYTEGAPLEVTVNSPH